MALDLKAILEVACEMMYLGIVEEGSYEDSDGIYHVRFSVPETTDMKLDDRVLTSEEIMKLAKIKILKVNGLCDQLNEEELEELKKSVKFWGKIRIGEHWTEEKGSAAMDDLVKQLGNKALGFMEV